MEIRKLIHESVLGFVVTGRPSRNGDTDIVMVGKNERIGTMIFMSSSDSWKQIGTKMDHYGVEVVI